VAFFRLLFYFQYTPGQNFMIIDTGSICISSTHTCLRSFFFFSPFWTHLVKTVHQGTLTPRLPLLDLVTHPVTRASNLWPVIAVISHCGSLIKVNSTIHSRVDTSHPVTRALILRPVIAVILRRGSLKKVNSTIQSLKSGHISFSHTCLNSAACDCSDIALWLVNKSELHHSLKSGNISSSHTCLNSAACDCSDCVVAR